MLRQCSTCQLHTTSEVPGIGEYCHCALDFITVSHKKCCDSFDYPEVLTVKRNGKDREMRMPQTYDKTDECIFWIKKLPGGYHTLHTDVEERMNDKVEEWHKSDSELSVYKHIGLTRDEYAVWVERRVDKIRPNHAHEHDPSIHRICYTDKVCPNNLRDCKECPE